MSLSLIVLTSFYPAAQQAVAYADALGCAVGGQVVLLHANRVTILDQYAFAGEGWRRQELERDEEVEVLLTKQAAQLRSPSTVEMATDLMPELAEDLISRYHPALFIIGRPDPNAAGPERLTPIVLDILRAAHMPVLLVPHGTPAADPPQRVLVAADGEAFGVAGPAAGVQQLLSSLGARVTVAHVSPLEDDDACARALKAVQESGLITGLVDAELQGFQFQHPISGILEAIRSTQADLVVVLARPRSYLGELFHKSVTAQLMHQSPVPVLVVPAAQPHGADGKAPLPQDKYTVPWPGIS
ncbi:universal stress protein [Hymenobacter sp. BT770]|uniref:universal stress protein n=1 Tax=Hymenobacter sp. BT770 TaxID=2886942 RepID=UPI001D12D43C|nr:universal stress protein [Hymenobacter sp. BT770]MCC3155355.1 universal stress protein [Hymenobacter sp. BT770]MDO3417389.1 universal stress protein [Hymenobacter sp. BT770]